jgi:hypothetical protein
MYTDRLLIVVVTTAALGLVSVGMGLPVYVRRKLK